MAKIERIGYGQVEPNHLSAQRTAQIYAQLPCGDKFVEAIDGVLENGQFVKYDYANKEVNLTGKGEWMLVFNEIKLYDDRKQMYRDFAMKAEECVNGEIVPRVFKTNIGDIYTTNMVDSSVDIEEGALLKVNDKGILTIGGSLEDDDMCWEVAMVYTLADGQPAIKIMRVK
jgi:hypothetical protein